MSDLVSLLFYALMICALILGGKGICNSFKRVRQRDHYGPLSSHAADVFPFHASGDTDA